MTDWKHWLSRYHEPRSPHSQRLRTVQRLITNRIIRTAPDAVSIVSICAGDGRDIIPVLAALDDPSRVTATLLELDPRLCALAEAQVSENRLDGVHVRQADAGTTDAYARLRPADIVVLVGVFGNIADADVSNTIEILPALCKPGALVIWSLRQRPRHRPSQPPRRNDRERVDTVRAWFRRERFDEFFSSGPGPAFYVGAHSFGGEPAPLPGGHRFFTFDLPPLRST